MFTGKCEECKSTLTLSVGTNICSQCGSLLVIRSIKPDSPALALPESVFDTDEDKANMARVLSTIILTLDDFSGLKNTVYVGSIWNFEHRDLPTNLLSFSEVLCGHQRHNWKTNRQRIIEWYTIKTTP